MRRQCQNVLGLTMTSLLLAGCISVRHDEASLPPVRQGETQLMLSAPQPTPIRKLPKPEPAPPEPLPAPSASMQPEVEPLPEPVRADEPTPAQPPLKSTTSCDETTTDGAACRPREMFVWDLHHRLGGWMHWQRRAPAVPTVIPPLPKFHPVPTHPVFAQQAVFTQEAPRQMPSTMGKPLPPPVLQSQPAPAPNPLPSPTTTPTPVPPPINVEPESSDREVVVPRTINNEFRIASPIPLSKPSEPIDDSWHSQSTTPR